MAAIATGAGADGIDIKWDTNGRFELSVNLAPGKFAEVCGKLPAGLKVRWDVDAGLPLDFNVHYHVGKEVVFPSKLTAVAAANPTCFRAAPAKKRSDRPKGAPTALGLGFHCAVGAGLGVEALPGSMDAAAEPGRLRLRIIR